MFPLGAPASPLAKAIGPRKITRTIHILRRGWELRGWALVARSDDVWKLKDRHLVAPKRSARWDASEVEEVEERAVTKTRDKL